MDESAKTLLTLGCLFLVGLITDFLGRRTFLPRVSLLLLFGFLIGPSALDLLPDLSHHWFPIVANIALVMVGFLLGESLTLDNISSHGRAIISISVAVVVTTSLSVFVGLWCIGASAATALLLAAISTATDPIATCDVIDESKAKGPFSDKLKGIVAIDDAWGLITFSLIISLIPLANGEAARLEVLFHSLWEIFGGLLLGVTLGIPMAYLSGRIRPGEPTLSEALGVVFVCGGLSLWLHVSYLLAAMSLGCIVANFARHHAQPFNAIKGIEWPFMIIFFVLTGASLGATSLLAIGTIGFGYLAFRIIGRVTGGWLGAHFAGTDKNVRHWIGISLLPQAGVALGMALVAIQRYPQYTDIILPIVIANTFIFEIIGPVAIRIALIRVRESHRQ